jgi:hypothetical protein
VPDGDHALRNELFELLSNENIESQEIQFAGGETFPATDSVRLITSGL